MDILVSRLTKANNAYRNGLTLLMTDEEYDAGMDELARHVPNHPLLKKTRAAPITTQKTVKMPYYLGSLNKAKVADDLTKWLQKTTLPYCVSEKLDGISGLWNPAESKLYLSGDDNTGLDVSAWLKYMSLSPKGEIADDIPSDVWIRGELIMAKANVPAGRLGRSIVNGIFHHATPNPVEAAKVRFVAYEVIGLDQSCTTRQQIAWMESWGMWIPWYAFPQFNSEYLTKLLEIRRSESDYDMDGLVLKTNVPMPRVTKGNPLDAIAWKPANGETKLTKVVLVEWNASPNGRLIPRVEIEPVALGGSVIKHVTGVHARRVMDWKIGPGATVIIRKGGDVIPVIDRVEVPAAVVFPPTDTWAWDGEDETTAVHIKQKVADTTTIAALYMRMVTRLGWENIGPALMKAVVDAGYTTVPLLRKATEADLKKLAGPVKGAHLYKTVQGEGWAKASEIDLFVASPVCPSGIGKTRLEALLVSEPDVTKWTSTGLVAPKGWSVDALREFQKVWKAYEDLRKGDWSFIPYPRKQQVQPAPVNVVMKGTVVFSGFRDAGLEASLALKGYKLVDNVKSDTKAVLIADSENPDTYTSTKTEKAKKISGCSILRRTDWITL